MSSASSRRTTTLTERLRAQLLAGEPARDPVAVCERLLAVQAQDPRGFRLAIRARTTGLTAADVDAALDDRSLVVTWLNRGTLHLVRREDYGWLHALTTPPLFTASARRLQQEGVRDPEGAVRGVLRALEDGPLGRHPLAEAVGLRGQQLIQVVFLAALRGRVVRGPVIGREQAYVLTADWLGPQAPVDRDAALRELGRRYLAGHGPADDRDLARWAGISLGDARLALADRPRGGPAGEAPKAARATLLGAFDPLLLGWADRTWVIGEHDAAVVSGGVFRPFAVVRGRVAATWTVRDGKVGIAPLAPLTKAATRALAAEAADVERFLGS